MRRLRGPAAAARASRTRWAFSVALLLLSSRFRSRFRSHSAGVQLCQHSYRESDSSGRAYQVKNVIISAIIIIIIVVVNIIIIMLIIISSGSSGSIIISGSSISISSSSSSSRARAASSPLCPSSAA